MLRGAVIAAPTDSGGSMFAAVRPHTKLAAALLTAGMVATVPAAVGAGPDALPVLSNVAVQPASFVTDALYAAGDVVSAAADTLLIGTNLALGLNYYWDDSDFGSGVPVNPLFLAAAALQNPGSALSYLTQVLLNPSDNYNYYTYPWYLKAAVLEPLIALLPAPLSSTVLGAVNGLANGINDALSNLPDPTAAVDSLAFQYNTTAGRLVYAVQNAIALPVTLLTAVTYYLAYLPASIEATFESAIQAPADIPGLLSNLVYNALDPDLYGGLLGNLSYNLLKPGFFLPAPIGESSLGAHDGLVYGAYDAFANAVSGLLSILPAPISPTPIAFPASATPAAAQSKAAAAPQDSSAAAADSPSAEVPTATSKGQSARKPVVPSRSAAADKQQRSAKSDNTTKTKGDSAGGKGKSARGNAA